jgi:hypothetical protein
MRKRRSKKSTSFRKKALGTGNPTPDRVASAFGIAYGEPDPERGLERLRALLDEAQTEEERTTLLGYGEVLQMRLMRRPGGVDPDGQPAGRGRAIRFSPRPPSLRSPPTW